ncbi:YdcF family protein [Mycolicibacterium brisbanense]|uniref:Exported protein n=1 Tax=Mycolicibacterium brisbanense TaxID=146020 RepID=A0A100VVK0_9MYCO|nr:YdcF family protein [Mycolicibacterium brisbanense]MCV7156798.1 YdcF family protein [Mycolicibacterium brisbanense]GAS86696.1 exported protein [Mycolicibacterium brisbanense]
MTRRLKIGVATAVFAIAVACGGLTSSIASAAPPPAGKDFSKPAIVILGYGLKPDGSMRTILYHRVLTGLAIAQAFPQSPVIVTGGNPQNGRTEASQMRNLLLTLGFPANRIIVEDKASSTVQNAQFSVPLAKAAGTSGIILVTSSTHQGRADQNFADAGANMLATVSFPDGNPSVNIAQFVRDVLSPMTAIG